MNFGILLKKVVIYLVSRKSRLRTLFAVKVDGSDVIAKMCKEVFT